MTPKEKKNVQVKTGRIYLDIPFLKVRGKFVTAFT